MSIFHRIIEGIKDACYIWREELKQVFRDEGVLIFCVIVPLVYPLLYSWIYNNEVVREVPVVIVDDSHSQLSRQFIRMCDASPDVKILSFADDLDEAKMLVSRQLAKGVYYIPADFATNVNRMKQGVIGVYCDMSLMLTYKAIYQTAVAVTQTMGAEIQRRVSGNWTAREDQITTRPLAFEDVPVFNPAGGYGNFVIPAVLMLIIQQTLVLGIGLAAGTARERNRYSDLVPIHKCYGGIYRIVCGKAMCPGSLSRERHAADGVPLVAAAVHVGCVLAAKQHPRLLAGSVLAVPQHVWHPGLCADEHHGRRIERCGDRDPLSVDTGRHLFRHRLSGLRLPGATHAPPCP